MKEYHTYPNLKKKKKKEEEEKEANFTLKSIV